jgi:predicted ATPase/DNA-binding CsgD family transcriptional regulator
VVNIRCVTTFLAAEEVTAPASVAEALAAAAAAREAEPAARLAVGEGASRAGRLADIANPGQTLVSARAAEGAPEGTALADLGVHRLRDLSPPLRVFALGDAVLPPLSLDASPNNLPTRPTTFVGRVAELGALRAALAGARLLTLTGPGGAGKTRLMGRLAAEEAGARPDGAWWVELGALADPRQVAPAVATAVGVLVDPARGAVESLRAQLGERRLLLCLDNCEHVLDAACEVAACLRDCPEVTIVASSREPLGLSDEAVWRVEPLALEDARALFLERAAQVNPELAVDEAAIASMCSRLDGSPLALELAAAWARTLTPRQIEAGLDDRFALLVRSPRDAVPRQASLLASMAWSHELLDEADRAVFRRLAVFAGGFDLEAAVAVCAADDVVGALARLVDKSLVVAEGERYRLPETIRAYAEDRLRAVGERLEVADRHLAYRLAWVRSLAPLLEDDKDRWRLSLAVEHDNLRAAIEHGLSDGDVTQARELAAELPWLWHLLRQGREGMDVLRRAIARAPDERSVLQARLLVGMALVADTAGPLNVELDAASRAAELAREQGDDALLALCLTLAAVGRFYTDLDGARETALQAEALAGGEGFVADAGRALRGILCHLRDDHDGARALLREAAARLVEHGERGVGSTALAFWSGSELATGELERARALAEQAIAVAAPLADHLRIGMARSALALALGAAGDVPAGLAALEPVLPLLRGEGAAPFLPEVGRALGLLCLWAGDADEAERWLAAEAASTDGGLPTYLAVRALPPLAAAQRLAGRPEEAAVTAARAASLARERDMPAVLAAALALQGEHHEALAIRADHGLRPGVVESLEAIAAEGTGSAEQDARLLAAAAAAREAMGLPPRGAAGRPPAGLEEAWQAGATLSLDEAAAYARRARGSRRRPDSGWESLTTAEREVVRLATEGLTNPEIGARLFMSRSTVKAHLSHVYAKLGVANRTELAAAVANRPDD